MEKEVRPVSERGSSIFVLYDQNTDRVLLERRRPKFEGDQLAGLLIFLGGKVDTADLNGGDPFENTLVREMVEELGVVPENFTILLEPRFTSPNGHPYTSRVYLVTKWRGEPTNREGKHEHVWMPLAEAQRLVQLDLTKEIVAEVMKKLTQSGNL